MILVNEREIKVIREKISNLYVTRTMKQKSKRHKYYVPEDRRVIRLLKHMRTS